jgi:hypothetical protein
MRLEYVCDMELAYREEPAYKGNLSSNNSA